MTTSKRSSKKKTDVPFNWGGDDEQFPQGMWDDFDGEIISITYEDGSYGVQIAGEIEPADYEYIPRGLDPDEAGNPLIWYGMGKASFDISEDGYQILEGIPQRNTNAVKAMKGFREAGAKNLDGTSLESLVGQSFHWSIEHWEGTIDGEKKESNKLYPSGKALGRARAGSESEGGRSRQSSSTRRSSRQAAEKAEKAEENGSSNGGGEEGELTEAFDLLKKVVGEAGTEGIRKRGIATALAKEESDDNGELIKLAAMRSTLDAAKKEKIIEEDEGVLYLPESTE